MEYVYKPKGVCSSEIKFSIIDNKLFNVSFRGGCNGNLKAISKLIDGCDASAIAEKLSGNTCGWRSTSCADQLSIAIKQALNRQ